MDKSPDAFRTISEAAEELDLPQHVLRFWETRFATIKPLKRGGGRRYYRPEDVLLLREIWRTVTGQLRDDELVMVQESEDLAQLEELHLDRSGTYKSK